MHAELCPVCRGSGRWWDPLTNEMKVCHGCGGLGWVVVPNEPYAGSEEDVPVYQSVSTVQHTVWRRGVPDDVGAG